MKTGALRYWGDLDEGEVFRTEPITLTRQDILEFAADFDPQPYHLDPEVANSSIFGGLCASGWHVTALMMRLLTDTFNAKGIDLLGSNRVSQLRWRKPVFADDRLASVITIVEKSSESSDKRLAYIDCDVEVSNQHGDAVINLTTSLMIGTGEAEG